MTLKNYFSASETSCKCGCGLDVKPELRDKLNQIREGYGKPISLNCGARCPAHNASVKGAPKSAHIEGLAADMKRTPELLDYVTKHLESLNVWIEDPAATPTWIHVQIRPAKSRIFKP